MKKKKINRSAILAIGLSLAGYAATAQSTTAINSLGGASSATPNQYLGSDNNYDVIFKSNNTERMRIPATGGVGIGITTPARALHVQTSSSNGGMRVTQTGTGFSAMELYNSTTNGHNWAVVSTGAGNGEGAGNFGIYDYTSSPLLPGHRFFIQGTTANVGISTTTPQARLHVNGNTLIALSGGAPYSAALIRANNNFSTASTPEYTWYNNDQTGVFHPENNVMGFTNAGTEVMRIHSNNCLGIGSNAPKERVQIGDRLTFHDGGVKIFGYNHYYDGQSKRLVADYSMGMVFGAAGDISFITAPSGAANAVSTFTTVMSMLNDGKVGIGVTAPTTQFEVKAPGGYEMKITGNGTGDIQSLTSFRPHYKAGTDFSIYEGVPGNSIERFYVAGTNGNTILRNTDAGVHSAFIVTNNTNGPAYPYVNDVRLFEVTTDGKVHIGSTLPLGANANAKLSVDGKIAAQSISVKIGALNWADYVFDAGYKPMALSEVESYYKANKHLPEVPSEAEVAANGIDVAEMNTILLKKIEEMTIYMVDQNKRIADLEKALNK